jgi:hypothetical protein
MKKLKPCGLSRPNGAQALAVWNTAAPSSFSAPTQYTSYQDLVGATHSVSGPVTIGPQPVLFTIGPATPTDLKATVK